MHLKNNLFWVFIIATLFLAVSIIFLLKRLGDKGKVEENTGGKEVTSGIAASKSGGTSYEETSEGDFPTADNLKAKSLESSRSTPPKKLKKPAVGTKAKTDKDYIEDLKAALAQPVGSGVRNNALRRAILAWSKKNPGASASWLAGLPAGKERDELMAIALGELAKNDPYAVLQTANMISDAEIRYALLGDILQKVFAKSPEDAVRWAEQLAKGNDRDKIFNQLANEWGNINPTAVSQWISSLPEGSSERAYAVMGAATSWAQKDPTAALHWAGTLSNDKERANAISGIARGWAMKDPGAALDWAMKLHDPKLQDQIVNQVAVHWAKTDPEEAAKWALTSKNLGTISAVARTWAINDPSSALDWALNLSTKDERCNAIQGVASGWAKTDVKDASQWAITLSNQEERYNAVIGIALTWARVNYDATYKWIYQLQLSDKEKKAIFEKIVKYKK